MNHRFPISLLGACCALAFVHIPALHAANPAVAGTAQQTGTVTGRVQNVVTGQYLNKARVSIKGTDLTAFTDAFGIYQLVNVRTGPVVLEVFYTDLDLQQIPLDVPAGGTIEQNVALTSKTRYGQDQAVVALDAFVISADKETDAQAIATNEQRFAPNIKNVMSTDSLGDTLGSSVGEFLKFIPGLTAEFDNADIAGISVRGIGGGMTSITTDGAPASNVWVSPTRSVDLRSMALNDISRIEVTKVPTPSTPADSLGGSVNMVGKSAFERSGALLRYGINLVGNGDRANLTLKKTPHSYLDRNTYKLLPGFNFDYTLPLGKNFGIVVSGMTNNIYNEQHFTRNAWASTGTGIPSSVSRPYLQSYLVLDGPRNITRNTLGLKADWRVTPHSVLSLGGQLNRATTEIGTLQVTFNAGATGTPTPATGSGFSYSDNFTIGATGRASITNNGTNQLINQETTAGNLNYRFDDGKWRIEAGVSTSFSLTKRRYEDAGIFYQMISTNRNPIRISFLDIVSDRPGKILVFDNANQPVDYSNIDNYRGTTTNDAQGKNWSNYDSGNLSVRRRLDFFPFPSSVQLGGSRRIQTVDLKPNSRNWTFNGPDGNPLASLTPYLMQVYKNQDSDFGFKNIPWLSPSRSWSAFQANPLLFVKTLAQQVAEENYRITNSEHVQETVSALYLQGEASFFKSRLKVLTGVRYEKTLDEGQGSLYDPTAVFVRNANGTFAKNAAGQQIRKPEAGLAGSMEDLRVTRQERAATANRTYDGFYPSLHLTYDIRENFLARAAYARTYGRPNFTDVIPRTTISERDLNEEQLNDPTIIKGTLTVRNTSLRPWTADNFDLSLEYYTQQGGLFSASVFVKEIKNFFGDAVRFATLADLEEVGLEPEYVGWNLSTKFNSGDARITGGEFNLRHSLRGLGRWGAYFTLFANATKLNLAGNRQASFTSFIPKSGNWGASFSRKQITVTTRWNYRGLDRRGAQLAFGPDGYEYYKARTTLDMYLAYQLTRRLSLAGSINNLLNEPQTLLRYGSSTPDYAKQYQRAHYGVQFGLGLKGTY
jgi:iron complex outermembrane receptor protein